MNADIKATANLTDHDTDSVVALVEAIRAKAPRLGALRIDALKVSDAVAFLDKMPKRVRVVLSGSAAEAITEIRLFLGCQDADAAELLDLLKRLAAVNPSGAWLLRDAFQHQQPPVTADSFHGGAASAAMNAVFRDLSQDLPDIARIEVDEVGQGTQAGFTRRRIFLRVIDIRGRQVAALDTAQFTPVIRVLAGIQDGASRFNLERAKIWAQQLGVPLGELALLLQDLSLLTVLIPSPALKFRD